MSHLHQYAKLCNLTENEGISVPVPDFLFELEHCDQINARFEKMRADRNVFYAFHGSRLENFHSIIHNGLHCHLNKVSAATTVSSLCDSNCWSLWKMNDAGIHLLLRPGGNVLTDMEDYICSMWFPFLCAELSVWRGHIPHQWSQHGCPLQSPQ